jgi:hypothetical protein
MSERGKLLFRVPPAGREHSRIWLLILGLAFAAVILVEAYWRHRPINWPLLVMAGCYTTIYFIQRRGSVYENGILLPADTNSAQGRFISWAQIERYHWDGDVLTIVPTSSMMAGADLGRPLLGGSARVPADKRPQMEGLLAKSPAVVH